MEAITQPLDSALSKLTVSVSVLNDSKGFIQSPDTLRFDDVEPGQTVSFTIELRGMLD